MPSTRAAHPDRPAAAGAPRRADTVEVIGAALLVSACGVGHHRIAADLDRPAATVRGWIRRATECAEHIRGSAAHLVPFADAVRRLTNN